MPDITFHDLRNTYTTLLLKNNYDVKAVSCLLGHAKEIITADVYGDTHAIIEDCLYAMEPFMDEVLPVITLEEYCDFSDMEELEWAAVEYLAA